MNGFSENYFLQERGNHKVKKVLVVLFQNLRFHKTLKFKMVSNSDLCFMQCKIWGVGKFHHKAILYIVSIYKIYACDLLRRSVFLPPLFSRFGLPNPFFEKRCQLIFIIGRFCTDNIFKNLYFVFVFLDGIFYSCSVITIGNNQCLFQIFQSWLCRR